MGGQGCAGLVMKSIFLDAFENLFGEIDDASVRTIKVMWRRACRLGL